jgi:four helix bundle protein
MDLAVGIYATTERSPQAERFGLLWQMRKAAASIPANIAEGHRRRGVRSFLAFLSIAAGSHAELETHVELAVRVGVLSRADASSLAPSLDSVGRQLTAIIRVLNERR